MKHIFKPGTGSGERAAPPLLLLHGTGGTETDLLPLAELISPASPVLGVRGNVLENGMPRFFRRLAAGVFDEEDLVLRTRELNDFLDEASEQYGFDRRALVAVGYSNGANIAASLLFHYPQALGGAILHHPMVPRRGVELPDMAGLQVFIGAGRYDAMSPARETEELERLLSGAGADVHVHWEPYGHQLTPTEVDAAAAWFRQNFS
ncbi:MAG: alpha/beta hydrolase [Paenibacillus macerans]|uniref:Carboxylesterase n=1 Tax=Paenibacillus macerans TaxID=44252 RepID=A0A090Y8X8_PAEMA|nr:alpha/beta hydrolase [Paenibacillus macerans]KFM94282.1 phospholipase/Carboxylesterase family protein [Paenibacillus macerans]MCY7561853.1 alpha/beta hydrolase [Paenibacillus macerans]MDU7472422.1 alpha/beta hydrolase [Paenibacillus macerans]MEC0137336.1 alpha/beta hydrolase [Paenibacillus macerans]MEC0149622.1 alpha/beta hydrolase [Paenibacillus macerans]